MGNRKWPREACEVSVMVVIIMIDDRMVDLEHWLCVEYQDLGLGGRLASICIGWHGIA